MTARDGFGVLSAMRVGEAYCYDAGAANSARQLNEARAAVAELIEADEAFDRVADGYSPFYADKARLVGYQEAKSRRAAALRRARGEA